MVNPSIKTDRQIKNASRPGYYPVEPNLRLLVSARGRKSFEFRGMNRLSGKIATQIIGHYPNMGLNQARQQTELLRQGLLNGKNPKDISNPALHHSFEDVANNWFELEKSGWQNKHTAQRHRRVIDVVCSEFHGRDIKTITRKDIAGVLTPIWLSHPETADKAQNTILRIFDYADAIEIFSNDRANPADLRKLKLLLPSRGPRTETPHANLAPSEIPMFFSKLYLLEGYTFSRLALEMFILTIGGRIAPVISMEFDEIDLDNAIWYIPGDKMKSGKPFRIPLGDRALNIVKICQSLTNGSFLFPSKNSKTGHVSDASLRKILHSQLGYSKTQLTTYGFKHSFKGWALETGLNSALVELCMDHKPGNKVEQAYITTDAIKERRQIMLLWEQFCLQLTGDINNEPYEKS